MHEELLVGEKLHFYRFILQNRSLSDQSSLKKEGLSDLNRFQGNIPCFGIAFQEINALGLA